MYLVILIFLQLVCAGKVHIIHYEDEQCMTPTYPAIDYRLTIDKCYKDGFGSTFITCESNMSWQWIYTQNDNCEPPYDLMDTGVGDQCIFSYVAFSRIIVDCSGTQMLYPELFIIVLTLVTIIMLI